MYIDPEIIGHISVLVFAMTTEIGVASALSILACYSYDHPRVLRWVVLVLLWGVLFASSLIGVIYYPSSL